MGVQFLSMNIWAYYIKPFLLFPLECPSSIFVKNGIIIQQFVHCITTRKLEFHLCPIFALNFHNMFCRCQIINFKAELLPNILTLSISILFTLLASKLGNHKKCANIRPFPKFEGHFFVVYKVNGQNQGFVPFV